MLGETRMASLDLHFGTYKFYAKPLNFTACSPLIHAMVSTMSFEFPAKNSSDWIPACPKYQFAYQSTTAKDT
jgi:hypothetical protein